MHTEKPKPELNMHIEGRTLLMKAAAEGNLQLVITLIQEGSDVNAVDRDGDTALMFAANRGHYLVVKVLLANGADVLAMANNGWTALRAAKSGGDENVVRLVESAERKLLKLD
ncbi:MAG TPA: ankyrin repeat domain-containing protein [Pyrinomonadaceae bacterium]|jgi:serine/threonine-protein phosphatase 6 regulatory ankyrin repeat subunit B